MILVLSSLLSLSFPIKVKAITKDRLVDFEAHYFGCRQMNFSLKLPNDVQFSVTISKLIV